MGIDLLLVGDSAANTVFGERTTLPLTLDTIIALGRGVTSAVTRAMVVVDLPFGSYEVSPEQAVSSAVEVMKRSGAHAVKLEGGVRSAEAIRRIVAAGIPVCAHVGFTPQSEHGLGGPVVQGRGNAAANALIEDAHAVEEAGAFAVVLELVPSALATKLTETLTIPTIGIGAGADCDGQILVWTDAFGMSDGPHPRFVRTYASLGANLRSAASDYRAEVRSSKFPAENESYGSAPGS